MDPEEVRRCHFWCEEGLIMKHLITLFVSTMLSSAWQVSEETMEKPNVLFIAIDDLRLELVVTTRGIDSTRSLIA